MRFSVGIPFPHAGSELAELDAQAEVAIEIEAAGLDACWVTDHPFPLVVDGRAGHQALDPFVALGYLAAATTRLGLHLNVVVLPYRNPFLVARAVATLDRAARGRVLVGIGAGYMQGEFEALGVDYDERGSLVEEGVEALRAAWTGEPVHLETPRFAARGNTMQPVPWREPHPPLWRGGNTRKAIESAAASFDGWCPFEVPEGRNRDTNTATLVGTESLRKRIDLFHEAAERHGREGSLDVCLTRPRATWLDASDDAVLADLGELEEVGVTWLAAALVDHSRTAFLEQVERLAELARAHAG